MKQTVLLVCSFLFNFSNSSVILGFFPFTMKSHYNFVKPLLSELADRGHKLTIYTVIPDQTPPSKYHEIDIGNCLPKGTITATPMDEMFKQNTLFKILQKIRNIIPTSAQVLQCKPLAKLLKSTQKFDLFLTDIMHNDWFVGFAYKFQIPIVNVFPNSVFPWLANDIAATIHPAYVPCYLSSASQKMNFHEKVHNTYVLLVLLTVGRYYLTVPSNKLAKEIFGEIPPLVEIVKNTSITLENSHPSLQSSYPILPNLVRIGGMNIGEKKKLPKNIEKFINESEHGVVYFCMGSQLRGETFSSDKIEAFLYTFSKIPQRVLWKWEGETMPGKTNKIMISKWMPQRDILAHPNVKLFISHGGMLSTTEAVYEGVPVLGIPIFGDQKTNILSVIGNGAGELLNYNEISKEALLEKVQRLLNDPKYKENAELLSERYRDRPMSALDTAVYWVEYVIRHKGAPHLRSAAADMSWYQYLLFDVISFAITILVIGLVIICYSIKFTFRIIFRLVCSSKKCSPKSDKKVEHNR